MGSLIISIAQIHEVPLSELLPGDIFHIHNFHAIYIVVDKEHIQDLKCIQQGGIPVVNITNGQFTPFASEVNVIKLSGTCNLVPI